MTQEVQPLTWQKRTNLEEHQQFFSKINEIIGNLAPTVDEAEAAIAQANQAIASANAAIATANAASASADAASQQAQTAADTVAGYDARMTAVESKNSQQDSDISALQVADGQDVKIAGNQNITGIKTVPTEATGVRSQQIANSTKVGAELDNYAPMLRTTGNQEPIEGKKTFAQPTGWVFGSNSSIIAVGTVFTIASIPRANLSGTRGHLGIWLKSRSRADSLILSIYHHNGEAQDLEIIVPHQGETTKTWTLSQDDNNIYLSFNGDGNAGADGWFAQGVFSVATNLTAVNASSANEAIPGTIIKSVTL